MRKKEVLIIPPSLRTVGLTVSCSLKFFPKLFLSHPYGCVPTALTNVVVVCQCVWPWFTFLLKSLAYRIRHAYYSACVFYTLIYIDVLVLPRQRKRLEILIRLADLKLPAATYS